MTLKDKAKTYNFWISLVSAIVLIVRIIGDKFNIFIDTTLIMDVTTGLCSVFVILGILSAPKIKETKTSDTPTLNCQNIETNNNISENFNPAEETKIDVVEKNTPVAYKEENTPIASEFTNDQFITNDLVNTGDIITETPNDNSNNITESEELSLDKLIENLRADIHKANMLVEKLSKEL